MKKCNFLLIVSLCFFSVLSSGNSSGKQIKKKKLVQLPDELWSAVFHFIADDFDVIENILLTSKHFKGMLDNVASVYRKNVDIAQTNKAKNKLLYYFLALVDPEKKNKISSNFFLALLDYKDSLHVFNHILSKVPVYNAVKPDELFEMPHDKYTNFLISKDTKQVYQLEKKLREHKDFKSACHLLILLTPIRCSFLGKTQEFTPLDWFENLQNTTLENQYEPELEPKDYSYKILEVYHQGKHYLLKHPKIHGYIKENGDLQVLQAPEYQNEPKKYYEYLKKR